MPDYRLITISEVAELLGVTPKTISVWARAGKFPQPIRHGRVYVRWRSTDIEAWIEAKLCSAIDDGCGEV